MCENNIINNYNMVLNILQKKSLNKNNLIAVSKTFPYNDIETLYNFGHFHFGESKAQELRNKYDKLKMYNIKWHYIGVIQTNKIKYIVPICEYIHSVSRIKEIDLINKIANNYEKIQKIFIEVNISQEETKSGISVENLDSLIKYALSKNNLKVIGLMTMAPFYENIEKTRPIFKKMKNLQLDLNKKYNNIIELSMGMSNDYEIAIDEGASFVRIGSKIFGNRG